MLPPPRARDRAANAVIERRDRATPATRRPKAIALRRVRELAEVEQVPDLLETSTPRELDGVVAAQ
jgi:hypothetical protein